jgi:hypothetical protein
LARVEYAIQPGSVHIAERLHIAGIAPIVKRIAFLINEASRNQSSAHIGKIHSAIFARAIADDFGFVRIALGTRHYTDHHIAFPFGYVYDFRAPRLRFRGIDIVACQ